MNIDIAIAGLFFTGFGFAWKIINEIKSEQRRFYECGASQNQKIEKCFYQIDLLKSKFDGEVQLLKSGIDSNNDKYLLLANQLQERIDHNRQRLFEELDRINPKDD